MVGLLIRKAPGRFADWMEGGRQRAGSSLIRPTNRRVCARHGGASDGFGSAIGAVSPRTRQPDEAGRLHAAHIREAQPGRGVGPRQPRARASRIQAEDMHSSRAGAGFLRRGVPLSIEENDMRRGKWELIGLSMLLLIGMLGIVAGAVPESGGYHLQDVVFGVNGVLFVAGAVLLYRRQPIGALLPITAAVISGATRGSSFEAIVGVLFWGAVLIPVFKRLRAQRTVPTAKDEDSNKAA